MNSFSIRSHIRSEEYYNSWYVKFFYHTRTVKVPELRLHEINVQTTAFQRSQSSVIIC